ncbi:MAG TPA: F0F1 ATP synthase subunit delta [Gemmatimonadales bacterium]|nr:F0F1 ATP synthase subunit delta [Gemmatimonadales bacterium]
MKSTTVARNYAEALFAAASAKRQTERFGELMDAVAGAVSADQRIAVVLESPRVAKGVKSQLLKDALEDAAPREFVNFLQAVVRRGRQGLLTEISAEYQALLDVSMNRVHAGVTLADEADGALRNDIAKRLEKALGKDVRAHFRSDGQILGGVIVKVGDRVYDGSLRRRLMVLKRKMMTGD